MNFYLDVWKKIMIFALTCAMVSLASCDKIKEATSRDFKVNNVKFDFTATPTTGTGLMKAETLNTFSVARSVNISELGSSDVTEYAGKISKVVVNSSSLKITTVPAGAYTVANVTVTAEGVSGSLLISSYTLGDTFTPPSNMNTYTSALIMKLLSAKTVTVTISGQTDAPTSATILISYESNLLFTASLL